jgi:hypothetical protein
MADMNHTLKLFDLTEANLTKLERLWDEICAIIPEGIAFGIEEEDEYDEKCRLFRQILMDMPAIDGYKIGDQLMEINEIGQARLDASEVGEFECQVSTEEAVFRQKKSLAEYRFKYNQARKKIIRQSALQIVGEIDGYLIALKTHVKRKHNNTEVKSNEWTELKSSVSQLEMLFGSSVTMPNRWNYLIRHMSFGQVCDVHDIIDSDWPAIKSSLEIALYEKDDPLPIGISDLSELTKSKPKGKVTTKLTWNELGDDDFERLIYNLIGSSLGYENPEWLTQTNAPDRGRDLSVIRIHQDALSGIERQRVIVQCKHWLSRSVGLSEIANTKEQMKLWEPPSVDVLILVTSGRFTTDAIAYVEKHNQSDTALKIEMWPESHLERLLAGRPDLLAEFRLRK